MEQNGTCIQKICIINDKENSSEKKKIYMCKNIYELIYCYCNCLLLDYCYITIRFSLDPVKLIILQGYT